MWPTFVVLTLADGLILHLLPPVKLGVTTNGMTLIFGIIVATFGNLILVGAAAPWLAKRLAAREELAPAPGLVPPQVRLEVIQDRVGTVLLALGLVGLVAAGLGSRPVVVSETNATEANARAVKRYIEATGSPELIRNLETANTIKLGEDYFRTCIARDDRRRAFCLYVNTRSHPPRVKRDPSTEPNSRLMPRGSP
jgi:hypothetical protein